MQGKGDVKAPNFSKEYEKGLKVYLKYLPKELQQELMYRQQYDPLFIEQQLGLQHKYDPALAQEQYEALQRRDPQWLQTHGLLGEKVQQALERGYLDPRQEAAYQRMSELAGRGEPQRDAAYGALGKQVTGDTLRGNTADPDLLRQIEQGIEQRLSANPLLGGNAPAMARAVYTGQRLQALKQQRQQATGQFLQTATPTAQREASLANFYGQPTGAEKSFAQAGSYLSSPTITQMENQIGQVQAPRSFGYVNPNAGYQGVQFGLQNFQNMIAANGMGGGGGGSGNPWMNAFSGASQGAQYGSVGGPYGAAGGAVTGAVLGAFGYPQYSDARLKQNISRTGLETPDGIPIVEYSYNGKRWRGVLAQEVEKVKPEAVYHYGNGRLGVFYSRLGIELKEVQDAE